MQFWPHFFFFFASWFINFKRFRPGIEAHWQGRRWRWLWWWPRLHHLSSAQEKGRAPQGWQAWDSHSQTGRAGNYTSPSSGEAYRDLQLTTNFELWVEIFCVPTCFHNIMRIPKPCLSVRTPKKKSPWRRRYQSYISNWYINGKVFTSTIA